MELTELIESDGKGARALTESQCILLVEDSPEDYETTFRSLRKSGLKNPIVRCTDGEDALDYLLKCGAYRDLGSAGRPGLILLDLNLPGTDGREVLKEIKEDSSLKAIPVVVLTTSSDERDIQQCYQFGANSYIQKPVDLEGFVKAMARMTDYWFELVIVPKSEKHA
ncbi:MAG: response regulator [Nitrospirales bacterium]